MNWFFRTFSTSVGKKYLMAASGLLFLLFLATHLLGNLSIYGGPAAFVSYAEHLHALGKLLVAAELGLAIALIVHVTTAVLLFFENRRARPVRYVVDKSGGGRTFSSQTMPYTGLLILAFVGVHLATLSHHFVDQSTRNIFQIAQAVFSNNIYLIIYTLGVLVVAFHVQHGLWSAFQSVGANHPKYMPFIQGASLVFAIIVAAGFGFLPYVILSMGGH
jgi:succinate dehydrogenase / fumarate reductase cytochrome b subunit|uniref:Succinate dehydrogenase cytochrome b subunit n=1 Tax=Desulfobacca acetoxidans TaxID=60893 RepID=A0A7V6A5Z4_9BACT